MAKDRTSKCTFPSKRGGGWVTPAQYITEFLCIHKAKAEGKDLPDKFWELDEWSTFFRWQIMYANKLLKKYSVNAIVAALRDKRLYGLQSLSPKAKWKWEKVFDEYQVKQIVIDSQSVQTIESSDIMEQPRKPFGKKTNLARLREIEDDGSV